MYEATERTYRRAAIEEFRAKHTRVCPRCQRRKVIFPGDIHCIDCEVDKSTTEIEAMLEMDLIEGDDEEY